MANTNGSAFAGYGATNFSAQLGAVAMILGRYVPLLAALAFAGSVAPKTRAPESAGSSAPTGRRSSSCSSG